MTKRWLIGLTMLGLLLTMAFPAAAAETTEPAEPTQALREPGWCGEQITWKLEDGTLTISGTGAMDDFSQGTPWAERRDEIKNAVFTGGVTYIGAYTLKDVDNLEHVEFGDSLYEIGAEAFASCDGLTSVHLPKSFKIFGEGAFQNCKNLKEIHCEGKFPSFRQNCLWGTYAKIYFPAERPWSVEYIQQLEEAFKGRIEFLASDGSDPYRPEEQETTAPVTEPPATEPPATDAPTQAPATAEPMPTAPVETAPPETEKPETLPPATVPPQQPSASGGLRMGLGIIAAVLALLVLGALIFRGRGHKGRYSA